MHCGATWQHKIVFINVTKAKGKAEANLRGVSLLDNSLNPNRKGCTLTAADGNTVSFMQASEMNTGCTETCKNVVSLSS